MCVFSESALRHSFCALILAAAPFKWRLQSVRKKKTAPFLPLLLHPSVSLYCLPLWLVKGVLSFTHFTALLCSQKSPSTNIYTICMHLSDHPLIRELLCCTSYIIFQGCHDYMWRCIWCILTYECVWTRTEACLPGGGRNRAGYLNGTHNRLFQSGCSSKSTKWTARVQSVFQRNIKCKVWSKA